MKERTESCVALFPAQNLSGSWVMHNLDSNKKVRRENYKLVRDTNLIKARMDALSRIGKVVQFKMPEKPLLVVTLEEAGIPGVLLDQGGFSQTTTATEEVEPESPSPKESQVQV